VGIVDIVAETSCLQIHVSKCTVKRCSCNFNNDTKHAEKFFLFVQASTKVISQRF